MYPPIWIRFVALHRKNPKSQSFTQHTRFISHSIKSDTYWTVLICLIPTMAEICGLEDWLQWKTGMKRCIGSKLSQPRTDTHHFYKQSIGQNQSYSPHLTTGKVLKGRPCVEYLVVTPAFSSVSKLVVK